MLKEASTKYLLSFVLYRGLRHCAHTVMTKPNLAVIISSGIL